MTTEEGSGWCRPSPDSPDCRLIDEGGEFRRQDLYVFVGVNFAHDVPVESYGGSFGVSRNLRHLLGVLFREHISVCIGGVFVASAATAFTTHSYLPFGSEPPRRFCNFIISPKAADVNLLWRCLLTNGTEGDKGKHRRTHWRGNSQNPQIREIQDP